MKLNHILLSVENVNDIVSFFENIIGLKSGFRPPFPFDGAWLYDENGLPAIHISKRQNISANKNRAEFLNSTGKTNIGNVFNHVAFSNSSKKDYKQYINRLEKENYFWQETIVPEESVKQVFVMGPEEIVVEIQFPY